MANVFLQSFRQYLLRICALCTIYMRKVYKKCKLTLKKAPDILYLTYIKSFYISFKGTSSGKGAFFPAPIGAVLLQRQEPLPEDGEHIPAL